MAREISIILKVREICFDHQVAFYNVTNEIISRSLYIKRTYHLLQRQTFDSIGVQ